ncbi:MAG: pyridoxal phosphate-dependent aminotransferase [Vulcanimicrobiota bacterium]
MKRSATLAINEKCAQLRAEGRSVYKLGLGQSPFPVPESVVDALQQHSFRKEYTPVQGLPELRQAVADYHQRRDGLDWGPSQVVIGPGSKELMFLLQLAYYGELLLPSPSWVSYAPQAQIAGRQVNWLPTLLEDGFRLKPEVLDAALAQDPGRPRLLILNYPNNPTGTSYDQTQLEALAEVARRHRLLVLSDEIYGEVHHRGQHLSLASLYPEGTIVSGGLSKWCGAGGWRLGTFFFPPNLRWLLEAVSVIASESFTSTSAPIQCAGIRAFSGGPDIEDYLTQSRRILSAVAAYSVDRLRACGAKVPSPDGAFYLFADFTPLAAKLAGRGLYSSTELCRSLLEDTGVAILPGSDFGRPSGELTARLAIVDFDGRWALLAAPEVDDLDEQFVQQHCPRLVEAFDRLAGWLG